jgi:4-hydroxy-2-oxoheptanedioate aldolase
MIDHAIARIAAAGKPSGMLTFDPKEAETYRAKGVGFIAVGSDVNLLVNGAAALRAQFG